MSEAEAPGCVSRLGVAIRWAVAAACLTSAAWLACWTVFVGAAWWAGAAALSFRGRWFTRAMYAILGLSLVPWCLHRYDARAQERMAAVKRGGPKVLSTADLAAIYGLNLAMGAAGFGLGFPEVAAETWGLAWPGDAERRWSGRGFPTCAPKVAAVVEGARQRFAKGRTRPVQERVAWPTYGASGTSVRAALALNPVTVKVRREGDVVHVEGTVPVNYPPGHRLVFGAVGPFELAVEEGLFHAAEERGWLHPYAVTWVDEVPMEGALGGPCEAWSVRLGEAVLR